MGWSLIIHQDNLCLFPCWTSVKLVHPRAWFKQPVANYVAIDRSKVGSLFLKLFVLPYLKLIILNPCYLFLCTLRLHGGCVFWEWKFHMDISLFFVFLCEMQDFYSQIPCQNTILFSFLKFIFIWGLDTYSAWKTLCSPLIHMVVWDGSKFYS